MKRISIVVTLIALVACGKSGPTKAEFVASADKICSESQAEIDQLPEPQTIDDVKAFGEAAGPIGDQAMADLRALEVPEGDEAAVDAIFDKFQEGFDLLEQLVSAATAGDEVTIQQIITQAEAIQKDGNELAAAYGMQDCSEE